MGHSGIDSVPEGRGLLSRSPLPTRHWATTWAVGDYVCTLLVALAARHIDHLPPHQRAIGPQLHDQSISYPHVPNREAICPSYYLYPIALDIPLVLLALLALLAPPPQAARGGLRHRLLLLSQLWLGLLSSLAAVLFIVCAIKVSVGRLRPDFLARCVPRDGVCTGDAHDVLEGRKSFPSGHTAVSFAGLGYLSLCLGSRLAIVHTPRAGTLWKYVVALAPWLGALLVGLSRIADYWHHWEDVLCGALLGHACAYALYRLRFPPLGDPWPLALASISEASAFVGKRSPPDVEAMPEMTL
jgi:diacylglycerol diphosphate phosphatase/phosphatidate phosphatase